MKNKKLIRLLLVDDHQLVRLGLISLLETTDDIIVVGEASTGIEAVQWTHFYPTDVILMDLNMPGMSGLEATTHILLKQPKTKILILSANNDTIYPFRSLRAGASGYLTKTAQSDKLLEAIRCVASGGHYLPNYLAKQLSERLINQDNHIWDGLSDRKLDVLFLLIQGNSTVEIARTLRLGVSTVNCYRYHIKRQLKVKNMVELLHLARSHQLIE